MNTSFQRLADGKDEWLTPPAMIKELGPFDLDPCSPIIRPWPTATKHYTREDDGLTKPWRGYVWLNPPYGAETWKWLARLSDHDPGGIALVFARTDTRGFHETVFGKASSVLFLRGRLRFYHVDGTEGGPAGAGSALVAYGTKAHHSLQTYNQGKKGRLLTLNNLSC